jgi:XTP/dITP diphosphohydrolase
VKKLLIATKNPGKLTEISQFLKDLNIKLLSLSDVGIDVDVEETGKTYKENSQKKAVFYSKLSNLPAISDDGGIEIKALGGAPGIHSRRWLGYNASDEELIEHLKKVVSKIPKNRRQASFKTVVSFAIPDGKVWSIPGEVKGIVTSEPEMKILPGYPYRSFFYIPKIKKFYHESDLTLSEQKLYNHRYIALNKLKKIIKRELK